MPAVDILFSIHTMCCVTYILMPLSFMAGSSRQFPILTFIGSASWLMCGPAGHMSQ
jgi:hypothetical protein